MAAITPNLNRALEPTSHANLRRILVLRLISMASLLLAIAIVRVGLSAPIAVGRLLMTLGILALFTAGTLVRLRAPRPVSDLELFGHLLADVGALCALLYFSGGPTNPFVSLFLLPLTVTATLLPVAFTWVMAAIVVSCYTLLMFFFVPLPHVHGGIGEFALHVTGMWVAFLISAGIVAGFVVKMALSLRERGLANAREETLRNERIVALGTLAAGAAHELGTPLATMAVIARELEYDDGLSASAREDLRVLRSQIAQCKHIISDLLSSAGDARTERLGVTRASDLIGGAWEKWRLLRPKVRAELHLPENGPGPALAADQTLNQAFINLLNNAADASPNTVVVDVDWDARAVTIDIQDRGPGLTGDALDRAGQTFFTTKPKSEGSGVGLVLANATIERFGGTVSQSNRPGGGAQTRVVLPVALAHTS